MYFILDLYCFFLGLYWSACLGNSIFPDMYSQMFIAKYLHLAKQVIKMS